jgi:heterotetrameric sarcosine oxidase gamma subunit
MTRPESAIVASLQVSLTAPEALFRLEVWDHGPAFRARCASAFGQDLPGPGQVFQAGGARILWREPDVWLLSGTDLSEAGLQAIAGDSGAVAEVTSGFARIVLQGEAWRSLLSVGAFLDVEHPDFGPGRTAATLIHHTPVLLDVQDDQTVVAHVPRSYGHEMLHFWQDAARRIG